MRVMIQVFCLNAIFRDSKGDAVINACNRIFQETGKDFLKINGKVIKVFAEENPELDNQTHTAAQTHTSHSRS